MTNLDSELPNVTASKVRLADAAAWSRFTQIASLVIGVGLFLSGLVFFFAYNWQLIHRFVKLGIVAFLMLALMLSIIRVSMSTLVRNVAISSMSVLVGAFLAIIGQAYNVEADTHTFFLTWALCIAVWVFIADFYPLWLCFLALISIGVIPFFFGSLWCFSFILLYGIAWLAFFFIAPKLTSIISPAPSWFKNLLITLVFGVATVAICDVIIVGHWPNIILALIVVAAIINMALKNKSLWFYTLPFLGGFCVIEALAIKIALKYDAIGETIILNIWIMIGAVVASVFAINSKRKEWKKQEIEE
ncbi:MAG: DUF2157 domain-containing protein [Salinivirgaceae bacterium]|nr:DUF2157 domain-containing protein [Salinivirgaceae bacterium]